MSKRTDRVPDLKEFIKENDQRLYDFCWYMLLGTLDMDELILSIFREFGEAYRRLTKETRKGHPWSPGESRLLLFSRAWQIIEQTLERIRPIWSEGHDMRNLKGFDDDILCTWNRTRDSIALDTMIMERLGRIDRVFRAPLALRDILHFEDSEAQHILGLRWGVYRHRLHRGRMELKDALRGMAVPQPADDRSLHTAPA